MEPYVSILNPQNHSYLSGTVKIIAEIYDEDNITRAGLSIDRNPIWIWSQPIGKTFVMLYEWNTIPFKDGWHTIEIFAVDNYGNILKRYLEVIVDNTTPLIDLIHPGNESKLSGSVSIEFVVSDVNFDKVELRVNQTLMKIWNSSGRQIFEWNTLNINVGLYFLQFTAFDKAGNTFTMSIIVTVEHAQPLTFSPLLQQFISAMILIGIILGALLYYKRTRKHKALKETYYASDL
ncbi:MAG: Ig-like domain-containing protein [Candidatus Heimdallarchaeota archaeon]